jgi:hypothetical protein
MSKNIAISIPTPCLENWDAMTPEAKGRFCGSCAKVVVDFSVMTDNEVLNYFKKNSTNTCGHFTIDQLDRSIIETQLQPKKNWRYWLASIASLLVISQRSNAQVKEPIQIIKGDTTLALKGSQPIIIGKIAMPIRERSFGGTIVDDNNAPIAGATIMIKNSKKGVAADANGKFTLHTNDTKIAVVISAVGFETKEVILSVNNASKPIVLKMVAVTMGEVVVVSYGTCHCRRGDISGSVRTVKKVTSLDTLQTSIAKVFKNEAFTIYPNPVSKSGTIHISVKEAGNYEVQILSNQSKLLYTQHHSTQSVKQVIQLAVPSGTIAGVYYVRLINTATQKQWVDKVLVQ